MMTKKTWNTLERLAAKPGAFEFYAVHVAEWPAFQELLAAGCAEVLTGEAVTRIIGVVRAEIATAKEGARVALDAGDFAQAKELISEIEYREGLLADRTEWYRVTAGGREQLAGRLARVAKRAAV